MEIIVVILFGLISMLFNKLGNRQEETPPRQRPVSPNQHPQKQKKSEDYARELFEEFQEPEPVKSVEVKKHARPTPKVNPVIEKVPLDAVPSSRASVRRQTVKKSEQPATILPKNEQELLQAFIFSEVIGPPKSKR